MTGTKSKTKTRKPQREGGTLLESYDSLAEALAAHPGLTVNAKITETAAVFAAAESTDPKLTPTVKVTVQLAGIDSPDDEMFDNIKLHNLVYRGTMLLHNEVAWWRIYDRQRFVWSANTNRTEVALAATRDKWMLAERKALEAARAEAAGEIDTSRYARLFGGGGPEFDETIDWSGITGPVWCFQAEPEKVNDRIRDIIQKRIDALRAKLPPATRPLEVLVRTGIFGSSREFQGEEFSIRYEADDKIRIYYYGDDETAQEMITDVVDAEYDDFDDAAVALIGYLRRWGRLHGFTRTELLDA